MKTVIRTLAVGALLAPLAACGSTNTKGSWACPPDKGVACASIATIDGGAAAAPAAPRPGQRAEPLVDNAGALRWWTATEAASGNFDRAPRREPDQFAKVLIGGWIDASGDYHAPSEVFALMRRGAWWASPPAVPLVTAASPPKRGSDKALSETEAAAVVKLESETSVAAPAAALAQPQSTPATVAANPGAQ